MKPGDTMIRESIAGFTVHVTIARVGRKWVTTDYATYDRYHVDTLEHERRWATLRTPEQHEAEQAERSERSERGKLRALLYQTGLVWSEMPMDRVRRLIAALEE